MADRKPLKGVIDDGTREIPIVNNFGQLICNVYMRPADFSILDRYQALVEDFDSIVEPLKDLNIENDGTTSFEEGWAVLKQVENELKKRINEVFDIEQADEIFAKRNPFSSVGGEFFATRVINVLGDIIIQAMNEEAELSEQRMAKYMEKAPTPAPIKG